MIFTIYDGNREPQNTYLREVEIMNIYYCKGADDAEEVEGAEVDCPKCGGTAIQTDSGIYCPDCANE